MVTQPTHPGAKAEVDPETHRIIEGRLAAFDKDVNTATDARAAVERIRMKLQNGKPR
jgi:hypothetical protein